MKRNEWIFLSCEEYHQIQKEQQKRNEFFQLLNEKKRIREEKKKRIEELQQILERQRRQINEQMKFFSSSYQQDGNQYKLQEERKERKEKIHILHYHIHYYKLLELFLQKMKRKEHILIIKNYPSIQSSLFFLDYCKKECLLSDEILSSHFIRLNCGYFNKCIEHLESLRISKGYSRNFLLIKSHYTYIQYIGAGPFLCSQ